MSQTSSQPLSYTLGFRTDTGRQRSHNEDAGATFELAGADAGFVVCDGMGGLRSGDVAANEAVRAVRESLVGTFSKSNPDPLKALDEALRRANDAVNALAGPQTEEGTQPAGTRRSSAPERDHDAQNAVMGTTCVAGVLQNDTLFLAHAGDSRAYLWRRGHLTRLTNDHSFVGDRVRAGDMTEQEARVSRFRNIVTRAIGIDSVVEPELRRVPLEPGDAVLVCSDGLTTMMDDPDIAQVLNAPAVLRGSAERAAAQLVDTANKRGGHDNITVLLIRASGGSDEPTPAGVLDIEAPRGKKKRRPSPFPLLLLGALLGLSLAAALLYFYRPARARAGAWLSPAKAQATPATTVTPSSGSGVTVDLSNLAYDAPVRFADLLARGDILAYSPKVGLYFVADASGKVAYLSRTGVALKSVEIIEPAGSPLRGVKDAESVPSRYLFLATDSQGNAYISYTKRRVVEKKSPDGQLLAVIRGFSRPEAVAVDEVGNVYVVDYNEIKICRARPAKPKSTTPATPKPATGTGTGGSRK